MYKFYANENYDTPKAMLKKYLFYISKIFKTQDTFKTRSLSLKLYFVQTQSTYLYYYAPISQVCSNNECNKESIYVQNKQKCLYTRIISEEQHLRATNFWTSQIFEKVKQLE